MTKKIAVLLIDGFEETEAIVPADVWKRVGFDVVMVGVESDCVTGAHDIRVETDCLLADVDCDSLDCLFLPGGMPGAARLRDSREVLSCVKVVYESGIIAAICAAPIALAKAGIIDGATVTCYPGFEDQLGKINYTGTLTAIDNNVITGKGPGAVFEFAAKVSEALGKKQDSEQVLKGMMV